MESALKKLLPIAGILCGVFSTALAADDSMSQQPAGQIADDQMQQDITPSAGPRVSNGADVFVTADFIYWTARTDGMAYAFAGFGDGVTAPAKGGTYYPNWQWEPGFKVGLGLNLDHDGWDLFAEYTWLHSNSSSDTGNIQSTLYPIWNIGSNFVEPDDGASAATDSIIQASNNWSFRYNVIDLTLGRNYFVSQYLTLRPSVGFKGSWQTQDYTVNYGSPDGDATAIVYNNRMVNNQKYWGFGLRGGLDTAWHFTKNFSIYGNMGVSALWSHFRVSRQDSQYQITRQSDTTVVLIDTKNSFHTIKEMLEMVLGLRYETWFSEDDYHFSIEAGWEEQLWLNMNQLVVLSTQGTRGDTSLQGLTVKVRFDF